MVREGRIFISTASRPGFGENYIVMACKPGAQVASGSSSTTITVRAGHGFSANDKLIVNTDTTKYRTVSAVTSTTLTVAAVTVSAGDILTNLGADTGSTEPAYDGNGVTIYSDMDYSNSCTNASVIADSYGKYRYYHKGLVVWELVRTSADVIIATYCDVQAGITGPSSATDNAVVRFDGTSGQLTQNSVVTVGDTGAMTGISTLSTSGAATLASASITGAATVGTTLGVTGASTLASVAVTGAASVGTTLGVTGAATLSSNATIGGQLRRSVAAAITASTTQTQVGGTALTADINNVSVCANANDTVTLPTAVAGMSVVIMNNGAQTLKIYPAPGDNLGAGVDTPTTLAAGSNVHYASYDATNWEAI